MPDSLQALAAWTAHELRRGARLDLLVVALLAFAAALVVRADLSALAWIDCALSLAAGFAALIYSWRVRFDAAVFADWAESADLEAAMLAFDARLQRRWFGRRRAPRPLPERIVGALRLLGDRDMCRLAQGLILLLAMLPGTS